MTRKCHLCDNHADPRMNIGVHDGAFPLCDGCSPNEDETHIQAVSDRCRAAGPPRTDYTPSVGFNDTRLPH